MDYEAVQAAITDGDGVDLKPVASETELAAFEAKHRITLPDQYRAFLANVGNGFWQDGSPTLFSLAEVEAELNGIDPSAAFFYTDAEIAEMKRVFDALPNGSSPFADEGYMSLQKLGTLTGAITIATSGGNELFALVLNGAHRGMVWMTGEVDSPVPGDMYGPGEATVPMSFETWLAGWANDLCGIELP